MPELRAGDTVHHGPTGEDWVVAYVDGDRLAPCGWPPCEALLSDCTMLTRATDQEHRELLERLAAAHGNDKRIEMAKSALTSLKKGETDGT